jgi:hypothetical protein
VARLGPLPVAAGVLERLIEDGRATAATSSIDDLPPLVGPVTDEAGRALRDLREERL